MLEAVKHKGFDKLFYHYNRLYLIQRHFRYVGVAGQLQPKSAGDRPILYIMNHSSWWDGLLAYHAARTMTSGEHFFMMEEEQLRKYAFFRKLGAYSINRHNTSDISASLRYTARLLHKRGNIWIYPEGEIRPLEHRPLKLQAGVGLVLRLCPEALVVPVTLYHGLFRHSKPEATLLAGNAISHPWPAMDRNCITKELQDVLREQLDHHRLMMVNNGGYIQGTFTPLMKQGRSINEWFDVVRLRGRG
ncbi:lysophospholipid acyltransferase family protein [Paenibacillus sp. RS8]|uniref:lysophospholipid acyltransferase family protein n=1 Tax=Paenibacillus sp. RS8 TaxID=3242681 RepID=UPI0035C262B8